MCDGPMLCVVYVGRGDKEGSGNGTLRQLQCGVRHRDHADAVRDNHGSTRRRGYRRNDVADPLVLVGCCPVRLVADEPGRLEIAYPTRLPMVGLASEPSGHDKDVSVCGTHVSMLDLL